MTFVYRAALAAVMAIACMAPAYAQTLTTTYAADNGQAGNMFDVRATTDLKIDSFDIHMTGAGISDTVDVYWRDGTVNGAQNTAQGWSLLGSANVVSKGDGTPTHLPVGGLVLRAGQTYGIFIYVRNNALLRYTNGSNVFSNADLSLTTWFGKSAPGFGGTTFSPRQWNGTIYYSAAFTSCAAEGLTGGKLTMCRKICEVDQTPTALSGLIKLYRAAYREDPPCAR